jgi:Mrp family chromosome partitioning ATPase
MAEMMNIPVLGLVENFSYFECPDCGKKHSIFGESKTDEIAAKFGLPVLAKLPIDPKTAALADKGAIELSDMDKVMPVVKALAE